MPFNNNRLLAIPESWLGEGGSDQLVQQLLQTSIGQRGEAMRKIASVKYDAILIAFALLDGTEQ